MEISSADASAIQQTQTREQVQTAVAKKVLDNQKFQGQAALSLLEGAANLAKQGPITPGKGLSVDVRG